MVLNLQKYFQVIVFTVMYRVHLIPLSDMELLCCILQLCIGLDLCLLLWAWKRRSANEKVMFLSPYCECHFLVKKKTLNFLYTKERLGGYTKWQDANQ